MSDRDERRIESAPRVPSDRKVGIVLIEGHYPSSRTVFSDILHITNALMIERQRTSGLMMGVPAGSRQTVSAFHPLMRP